MPLVGELNSVRFEFEFSLGEARSNFLLEYQLEIRQKWGCWVRAHLQPWPLSSEECTCGAAQLLLTWTASSEHPSLGKFQQGTTSAWSLGERFLEKPGVINLCTPADVLPSSPAWLQLLPAERKVAGFICVLSACPIVLPTYNRIITTSHKN